MKKEEKQRFEWTKQTNKMQTGRISVKWKERKRESPQVEETVSPESWEARGLQGMER